MWKMKVRNVGSTLTPVDFLICCTLGHLPTLIKTNEIIKPRSSKSTLPKIPQKP
jgi:hypothetical protein